MTRWTIRIAGLLALAFTQTACSEEAGAQPTAVSSQAPARGELLTASLPEETPDPEPEASAEQLTDSTTKTGASRQKVAAEILGGSVDTTQIGVIDDSKVAEASHDGVTPITWSVLNMQDLPMEDILDALLYPDEYEDDEFAMPERIQQHHEQKVSIVGYMIPIEWKKKVVPEFMLVRDLMGCCFGGAPQPDEWISVRMEEGGADYYPYIPVVVTGTLRVEAIEDEAGYAAGCFHITGDSVEKDN